MVKIEEKRIKEIKKAVDKYVKSMEIKDSEGKITGTRLTHEPETLNEFFISGVLVGLNGDERQFAKMYFKEKLPYKEWVKEIRSDPNALADSMLHFRELQRRDVS